MRRCHRGARVAGAGRVAANHRRQHIDARGKDVDAGAVVRERRPTIATVGRADGDRRWRARRRGVAGVRVRVAGSHDVGHAGRYRALDCLVQRRRDAATEAHVGDGRQLPVGGDPVDTGDDARGVAAAATVEDAHADQRDALGDAVGAAADGAGHMRAVAVAVVGRAAVDGIVAGADAPGELGMAAADAGVDDVGGDAAAGERVGVLATQRQCPLVDPIEPPRRVGLGCSQADDAILLDEGHVGVAPHAGQRGSIEVGDVGRQGARHALPYARAGIPLERTDLDAQLLCAADAITLQHDDVAVGDGAARCGDQWRERAAARLPQRRITAVCCGGQWQQAEQDHQQRRDQPVVAASAPGASRQRSLVHAMPLVFRRGCPPRLVGLCERIGLTT